MPHSFFSIYSVQGSTFISFFYIFILRIRNLFLILFLKRYSTILILASQLRLLSSLKKICSTLLISSFSWLSLLNSLLHQFQPGYCLHPLGSIYWQLYVPPSCLFPSHLLLAVLFSCQKSHVFLFLGLILHFSRVYLQVKRSYINTRGIFLVITTLSNKTSWLSTSFTPSTLYAKLLDHSINIECVLRLHLIYIAEKNLQLRSAVV